MLIGMIEEYPGHACAVFQADLLPLYEDFCFWLGMSGLPDGIYRIARCAAELEFIELMMTCRKAAHGRYYSDG